MRKSKIVRFKNTDVSEGMLRGTSCKSSYLGWG